jgi:hypothetical protein
MSDARGALVLLASLPEAKHLLGDKGYRAIVRHRSEDGGEGRLAARGAEGSRPAHLPPRPTRTTAPGQAQPPAPQKTLQHRERLCPAEGLAHHRHAAHTRCGDLFLSAIALAASIIFWLR